MEGEIATCDIPQLKEETGAAAATAVARWWAEMDGRTVAGFGFNTRINPRPYFLDSNAVINWAFFKAIGPFFSRQNETLNFFST